MSSVLRTTRTLDHQAEDDQHGQHKGDDVVPLPQLVERDEQARAEEHRDDALADDQRAVRERRHHRLFASVEISSSSTSTPEVEVVVARGTAASQVVGDGLAAEQRPARRAQVRRQLVGVVVGLRLWSLRPSPAASDRRRRLRPRHRRRHRPDPGSSARRRHRSWRDSAVERGHSAGAREAAQRTAARRRAPRCARRSRPPRRSARPLRRLPGLPRRLPGLPRRLRPLHCWTSAR